FASVPCSGIQTALNSSSNGSLIVLDKGSTCTAANAGLPWQLPAHKITIDGNSGTVDAGGTSRVFAGTNVGATTIQNFTIRGGYNAGDGGAIYLTGTGSPTIHANAFYGNSAGGNGGGVYADV